jgi:hypothetical protein
MKAMSSKHEKDSRLEGEAHFINSFINSLRRKSHNC